MELCPKCNLMTAETNHNSGKLVCYNRYCLEEARARLQIKIVRKESASKRAFVRPPRYDEVFFAGREWLDSLGNEEKEVLLLSHHEDAKPLNRPKRVVVIGTTSYLERINKYAFDLGADLCLDVKIPAFDDIKDLDDLGICEYNRALIEWADEVHMIWDQRSIGTIADFFMCFALHKPFKIVYLNPKTILGVMQKYEKKMGVK